MRHRSYRLSALISSSSLDLQGGNTIVLIAATGVGVSNGKGVNFRDSALVGPERIGKGLAIGFNAHGLMSEANRDDGLLRILQTETSLQ